MSPQLVHAYDQLPALTNDDVLAFQLRQVLGDSGPRCPDEIGNILVAERSSQKRAARLFGSKIGSQFKQRNGNAFMEIDAQETGAAQQQSVALLQIVLMKRLERRFGARRGDTFESAPAQTADSAIIISLAPKTEATEWQQRKLGDRTWRKQGDGHPLVSGVLASNARDAL